MTRSDFYFEFGVSMSFYGSVTSLRDSKRIPDDYRQSNLRQHSHTNDVYMLQSVWKRSPFANGLGVRPFRNGLKI